MRGVRFIAGSGRSGTTWVQDVLADANGLRPVFEPLHPYATSVGDRYAFRALIANESHPELRLFLEEACKGQRYRLWMQYRQPRWKLLPPAAELFSRDGAARTCRQWRKFLKDYPALARAAKRQDPLIKCIRANLMLGWLSRQCGFRVVMIVRHPGAVIESELRGAWTADFALDRYRRDKTLGELSNGRYETLLHRRLEPIEALTLRWLIENQVPVERASDDGVTVVTYESLRSSPADEWVRICHALALEHLPDEASRLRASQQSSPEWRPDEARSHDRPAWMRRLSKDQLDAMQRTLDAVEFDLYRMKEPVARVAPRLPRSSSGVWVSA